MLLPPHNKVFIEENTLHVQSEVSISSDSDFLEGETLFLIPAMHFYG